VDTVYLGAWRREVFDRIGVFDEELVRDQDDEFNYRLRAAGGRILLTPAVKSLYTVRGRAGTAVAAVLRVRPLEGARAAEAPAPDAAAAVRPAGLRGDARRARRRSPFSAAARWGLAGVAGA
jgi:uncharacterized protein YegP (UPF0339 family)